MIHIFNDRFKKLRTSYKYTQNEIVEKLNVSVQTVYNWENNIFLPGIETTTEIAKIFHVSTDYLFDLDNRETIEISGLTLEQLATVQKLIDYIITANKN